MKNILIKNGNLVDLHAVANSAGILSHDVYYVLDNYGAEELKDIRLNCLSILGHKELNRKGMEGAEFRVLCDRITKVLKEVNKYL